MSVLRFCPRIFGPQAALAYAVAALLALAPAAGMAQDLYPFQEKGKWGYYYATAKVAMPPQYDEVTEFLGGTAWVRQDSTWTLVDNLLQTLVTTPALSITRVQEDAHIVQTNTGKYGLVNNFAEWLLKPEYDLITGYAEGMVLVKKENRWAAYNLSLRVLCPFHYQTIVPYLNGMAGCKRDGKWGYLDLNTVEAIHPKYEAVKPFDKIRAWVKLDGHWGVIDRRGDWVRMPEFDNVFYGTREGLSDIRMGGAEGFADADGKVVIPPSYEEVGFFSSGLALTRSGGLYGYVNKEGTLVIDHHYQKAFPFNGGCAIAVQDSAYGLINREGKTIAPFMYQEIYPFNDNVAICNKNGLLGVLDTTGAEIIPPVFTTISNPRHGMIVAKGEGGYGLYTLDGNEVLPPVFGPIIPYPTFAIVSSNISRYGYMNRSGDVVIAPDFIDCGDFNAGLAPARRDSVYGYINIRGQWVTRPEFTHAMNFQGAIAWVNMGGKWTAVADTFLSEDGELDITLRNSLEGGKWGLVNRRGKVENGYPFEAVKPFRGQLAEVKYNNRWGMCDTAGQEYIPYIYDRIDERTEAYLLAELNGKYGVVDIRNEPMIPFKFDLVSPMGSNMFETTSYTTTTNKGEEITLDDPQVLIMNGRAQVIYRNSYELADTFSHGLAPIFVNNLWGAIDTLGQVIIKPEYENMRAYRHGLLPVKKNDRWGYMNRFGRWVIEAMYMDAMPFGLDSTAAVLTRSGWGIIRLDGSYVLEAKWDAVKPFYRGMVPVKSGGKWGLADRSGALMLSAIYDDIEPLTDGYFLLIDIDQAELARQQDDSRVTVEPADPMPRLYGLADQNARVIAPTIYKQLGGMYTGLARCKPSPLAATTAIAGYTGQWLLPFPKAKKKKK